MDMHYCDIFTDCYHCPAPYCPYEKLEPSWLDDVKQDEEDTDLQDSSSELAEFDACNL